MGQYKDTDLKMKDAGDPIAMGPVDPEEPDEKWPTTGSKSWSHVQRAVRKIRETSSAPVFTGRVTKPASTTHRASASNASEARPRRRSHDNLGDYPEDCESCTRLSRSYERLIKEKEDSFKLELDQAATENDNMQKEIERLRAVSDTFRRDKEPQQQLEALKEECIKRDERIHTLESELTSAHKYTAEQKSENTLCHTHIDEIKGRLEKCLEEIEDIKFERDTFNGRLQSMTEERKEMKQAIDNLRSEIIARDNDVRGLKQEISRSRASNPAFVPDNKIIADYQYILSLLSNWSLSNFRKLEPENFDQAISGLKLDPTTYDAITTCVKESAARKCLVISSLVMRFISRCIFRPFLFGLDETQGKYLKELESSFVEESTEKEIQFWRSTTLRMLIAGKSHKSKVDSSIDKIISEIKSFLETIFPPSAGSPVSNYGAEALKTIITHAADLSLALRVQRPLYTLSAPSPGVPFTKYMESAEPSLDNDDGGGLLGSLRRAPQDKVRLTIFPLLLKAGSEDGEKYDKNYVLHKGKILKA